MGNDADVEALAAELAPMIARGLPMSTDEYLKRLEGLGYPITDDQRKALLQAATFRPRRSRQNRSTRERGAKRLRERTGGGVRFPAGKPHTITIGPVRA